MRPITLAEVAADVVTALRWAVNVLFESSVNPRYLTVRLALIRCPPREKTGWRYAHLWVSITASEFWWASIILFSLNQEFIWATAWFVATSRLLVV